MFDFFARLSRRKEIFQQNGFFLLQRLHEGGLENISISFSISTNDYITSLKKLTFKITIYLQMQHLIFFIIIETKNIFLVIVNNLRSIFIKKTIESSF